MNVKSVERKTLEKHLRGCTICTRATPCAEGWRLLRAALTAHDRELKVPTR